MDLPDWISRQSPLRVSVLGGMLLGFAIGMLRAPAGEIPYDAAGAAWQLPDETDLPRTDESWFIQVRRARLWGANDPMNEGAAAKRARWRLVGIIADPVPAALVAVEGDPKTLSLQVGDSLPDGSEIVAVTAETVEFQRDGCLQARVLYASPAATAGDTCVSTQ